MLLKNYRKHISEPHCCIVWHVIVMSELQWLQFILAEQHIVDQLVQITLEQQTC